MLLNAVSFSLHVDTLQLSQSSLRVTTGAPNDCTTRRFYKCFNEQQALRLGDDKGDDRGACSGACEASD